jgi:cephalosporin hydroxylase
VVGAGDLEKPDGLLGLPGDPHETQPDVLIELGVAHGGNLLYLSHLFRFMDKPNAMLIGVDIDTSRAADLRIPSLQLN